MKIKNFFKSTGSFMKKNVYYIILFVCISGIATMITLAAINGGKEPDKIQKDDKNIDGNKDDDDNIDKDVDTDPLLFIVPVENYQEGLLFSEDQWIQIGLRDFRIHKAMDFLTEDNEEVMACYDGIVTEVDKKYVYGNYIRIKHNDDLFTIYKSLSDDVKVSVGDTVKKGDVIGFTSESMGNEYNLGQHLHLEVEFEGVLIDPMDYLDIGDK